jgi:hypothetical protein
LATSRTGKLRVGATSRPNRLSSSFHAGCLLCGRPSSAMPRNHPERWPQPKQSARSEGWFGPPETTRAGAAERQTRASNLAQDNSLSGTVGQCGHKQVKWSRNVVIPFPGRVQSRVLLLAHFETDGLCPGASFTVCVWLLPGGLLAETTRINKFACTSLIRVLSTTATNLGFSARELRLHGRHPPTPLRAAETAHDDSTSRPRCQKLCQSLPICKRKRQRL